MRRATTASVIALALTALMAVSACEAVSPAGDATSESGTSTAKDQDPQVGIDAYNKGEFAEAETILAAVVADDPEDLEARRTLALALSAQGKNDEAIDQYRAMIEIDPDDHVTLYRMALLERLADSPEDAAEHLERALDLWSDDSYADELAKTYMQLEEYAKAAETWGALAAAEGRAPESAAQLMGLQARALQMSGDTEAARLVLESALELAPDDAQLNAQLEGFGD